MTENRISKGGILCEIDPLLTINIFCNKLLVCCFNTFLGQNYVDLYTVNSNNDNSAS